MFQNIAVRFANRADVIPKMRGPSFYYMEDQGRVSLTRALSAGCSLTIALLEHLGIPPKIGASTRLPFEARTLNIVKSEQSGVESRSKLLRLAYVTV